MSSIERHSWSRRQFLMTASGMALATSIGLGHGRANALTINPRSSWAVNRPPKGPLDAEDVRFLIVHHSASRNGHTTADAPAILRSFYDFHTGPEKGWNDIAYNFCIDSGGGIWEARAGSLNGPIAGDATGGNQGFTQLVCVIGDYNSAQPSSASMTSLVSLLAWLADRYAISTSSGSEITFTSRGSNRWPSGTSVTTRTITGHRTMSQTTCPGDNLNTYVVGDLMADVTAARGGEVVTPTTQPPSTSTTTSAPTTTTPPTTTTTPPTTTSTAARTSTTASAPGVGGVTGSSTTVQMTSSSAASSSSTSIVIRPSTATSVVLAAGESTTGGLPLAPLVVAGLAGVVGGALLWRQRRMSG